MTLDGAVNKTAILLALCFAGAFAGHLAHSKNYSFSSISNALIYANAVASFCVEKFGIENMLNISKEEINERINFIEKHNN